jgi:superfamily II DNA or RNA helicase
MNNVNKKLDVMQRKAVNTIINQIKKNNKALVRMATGTGKTEVMVKLVKKYKPKKTLILTNTRDITNNVFERFHKYGVHDVSLFDGRYKDLDGEIVIASAFSLGKKTVLKKIEKDKFDLLINDEAHHAPANVFKLILNHFDCPKVGVTATPQRPDGKNIEEYFGITQDILNFNKAQDKGLLAKHKAKLILTNSFINGASTINGDYSEKELEKVWSTKGRVDIIINSYKKYARAEIKKVGMKPKTICFCVNVKHAKRMSEEFKKSGIKSEYIVSDVKSVSEEDRKKLDETFTNTNKIEVMCVAMLYTEGKDIADVNCVLMARPTKSPILYTQQVGRATRIDGGKKHFFYLLDFADNTNREYTAYDASNLTGKSYKNEDIITEYLDTQDWTVINKRIDDINKKFISFEKNTSYSNIVRSISDKLSIKDIQRLNQTKELTDLHFKLYESFINN